MENKLREINEITEKIIGCAFTVSNSLGSGFLEKVYENAMMIELKKNGLQASPQIGIQITYDGHKIGEYYADILVEGKVVVELKAVNNLDEVHFAQCLNYLNASGLKLCLLMNFGKPRVEIQRVIN